MDILIRILERRVLRSRVSEFIEILTGEPHEYWGPEHFNKEMPGKFELSICAFSGNSIAGYIIASEKEDGPYIHKFMVRRELRYRSVGRKMLEFFESNAISKSHRTITLTVIEQNESAISFYSKNDFKITGRKKASDGEYFLAIMTKTLKQF